MGVRNWGRNRAVKTNRLVSLSVCQHDNFRTIKRRNLARIRMLRSKVKVTGTKKTKKCGILFGSRPLGRGLHAAFFSGAVLGARSSASSTPVGKSAHAV